MYPNLLLLFFKREGGSRKEGRENEEEREGRGKGEDGEMEKTRGKKGRIGGVQGGRERERKSEREEGLGRNR